MMVILVNMAEKMLCIEKALVKQFSLVDEGGKKYLSFQCSVFLKSSKFLSSVLGKYF